MRIVIVGDGKVGFALAKELSYEDHDVIIVDSDEETLTTAQETLDVMTVCGNGATLEVQQEADVGESDLLIAATSGDEVNILCCILARKLGCKHTIARVRSTEYSKQMSFLREDLGLSMVVNPERAAAQEIFRLLQFPSFLKRETFAHGRIELVEIKIAPGSALENVKLSDFYKIARVKVLVCVVERDGEITIPSGDFVLHAGDKISVTAAAHDLAALIKNLGIGSQKIHNVVIIGGSRIAVYLAEELIKARVAVKIIEKVEERCRELSEILPDALIIEGNGASSSLLHSEDIRGADAVVTLTGIDEENIIIAMYAGYIGVPKCIPKINNIEYSAMLSDKGVGSNVSPKLLTVDEIVRYVRAMETTESAVLTLVRIAGGKAEAAEFLVTKNFHGCDTPLAQLRIRPQTLVSSIRRDSKIIIPGGDDVMKPGDIVVIVTAVNNPVMSLNNILQESEAEEFLPGNSIGGI